MILGVNQKSEKTIDLITDSSLAKERSPDKIPPSTNTKCQKESKR